MLVVTSRGEFDRLVVESAAEEDWLVGHTRTHSLTIVTSAGCGSPSPSESLQLNAARFLYWSPSGSTPAGQACEKRLGLQYPPGVGGSQSGHQSHCLTIVVPEKTRIVAISRNVGIAARKIAFARTAPADRGAYRESKVRNRPPEAHRGGTPDQRVAAALPIEEEFLSLVEEAILVDGIEHTAAAIFSRAAKPAQESSLGRPERNAVGVKIVFGNPDALPGCRFPARWDCSCAAVRSDRSPAHPPCQSVPKAFRPKSRL